jgi:predicted flap endonuclease-1-like 5' DNA nuclease
MSDVSDNTCRRNCWIISAIGAAIIALLLRSIAAYSLGSALFFGLMFLVLFGAFLGWAFCTGSGRDAAPKLAPMPESRPAPAARQAAAAPAAVAKSEPVAEPTAPVAAPVAAAPLMASPPEAAKPAAAKPKVTAPVAAKPAPAKKADAAKTPKTEKASVKPGSKKAAPAPAEKASAKVATKTAAPKAPAKVATPKAAAKAVSAKPAASATPASVKAAAKPKAKAAAKPAKAPKSTGAAGLDAAMGKTKSAPTAAASTELLDRPRGGAGDDLKQIKGVGPALEKLLNTVGIWHFDQIASWKAKDIAFVDDKMEGFKGRITRDEWVKQARVLARGGATEFSKRVTKGEVY